MQRELRLLAVWYCCLRQHRAMDITATISSEDATLPPEQVCERLELWQAFQIGMAAISARAKWERQPRGSRRLNG